jgi:hypothetical protein
MSAQDIDDSTRPQVGRPRGRPAENNRNRLTLIKRRLGKREIYVGLMFFGSLAGFFALALVLAADTFQLGRETQQIEIIFDDVSGLVRRAAAEAYQRRSQYRRITCPVVQSGPTLLDLAHDHVGQIT